MVTAKQRCFSSTSVRITSRCSSLTITTGRRSKMYRPSFLWVDTVDYSRGSYRSRVCYIAYYNPSLDTDCSSVIAVTSLPGHAYGSWKSRQSSRMWLKELLPKAVLGLRVMTYGYDSRILGKKKSQVRMSDYTAKFIQHLENTSSTVSIFI